MSYGDIIDTIESSGFTYETVHGGAGKFDMFYLAHALPGEFARYGDDWRYIGHVRRLDWVFPEHVRGRWMRLPRNVNARMAKNLRVLDGGEWESICADYPGEDQIGVFSSYIDAVSEVIGFHQRGVSQETERIINDMLRSDKPF